MNRNSIWVVVGVIVLLVALFLLYLAWPIGGSRTSKEGLKTESNEVALAKKDCEIRDLNMTVTAKDSLLAQNGRTIALLIKTCLGKSSGSGSGRPSNRSYTAAPKTSGNSGNSGNANGGGGLKSSQTSQPSSDAEYKTVLTAEQKSKVVIQKGEVKFCVKLAERVFYPYIAVQDGKQFDELVSNGIGGYDLFILPSGLVGLTGKAFGIAADGTAWIRTDELAPYLQGSTPQILNLAGMWITAQTVNVGGVDYYVIPM